MRFFDNLSKTLSTGVDRAKYEADKFQRTSRINGEISNYKSQIETNLRQLGERALELYQQGTLQAPEIASLAQIIAQLRDQQQAKERELEQVSAETFEQYQASQPPAGAPPADAGQNVPIAREPVAGTEGSFPSPTSSTSHSAAPPSTDISGSGLPNSSSVGGEETAESASTACANCGYAVPGNAVFCPNCGARMAGR